MVHARVFCSLQGPARLAICHRQAIRSAHGRSLACRPVEATSIRNLLDAVKQAGKAVSATSEATEQLIQASRAAYTSNEVTEQPAQHAPNGWSLYNEPELYQRIFSFRDIPKEVRFLFDLYKQTRPTKQEDSQIQDFLEVGCGPAEHSMEALRQGARAATALDSNERMVEYARSGALDSGISGLSVCQCEATDLHRVLQEHGSGPFDVAFIPLGTFSHALTNEEACEWLDQAVAALRPSGLLCIELAHPGDVWDGELQLGDEWTTDDDMLRVEYGSELDDFNPITQVLQRSLVVSRSPEEGKWVKVGAEVVPQRLFTLQEMRLLASRTTGAKLIGFYGDYALKVDMEHADAYRMIVVLQKDE